jgi:hypothetical protein
VLLILIPLVWLAVTAVVVAACQTAARGDGDAVAPAGVASERDPRAQEGSRLVLVGGPTAQGEPRRTRERVRGGMHAPASVALPP